MFSREDVRAETGRTGTTPPWNHRALRQVPLPFVPPQTAALPHKAVSQPGRVRQHSFKHWGSHSSAHVPQGRSFRFTRQWELRKQTLELDFLGPYDLGDVWQVT